MSARQYLQVHCELSRIQTSLQNTYLGGSMSEKQPGSTPQLSYEAYARWHAVAETRYLEPARSAAVRLINELLDSKVQGVDRGRFRISTSRIKSPQRTYSKLTRDKYREKFTDYDGIPGIIDDLVGIRLICNNLSDITTLQEIMGELSIDDGETNSLSIQSDSHRNYFENPKESGYRAYHVNLVVPVTQASGVIRMRVEVQARTLLQDGWGELTHEDTYKPGSTVPPWIVTMSLRMAELLEAVDNIAQDLRTGLDIESQRVVEDPSPGEETAFVNTGSSTLKIAVGDSNEGEVQADVSGAASEQPPSEIRNLLVEETRRQVSNLTDPTPLALVSQRLTEVFGNEITKVWSEFGGFKKLLEVAVPLAAITGPAPGYVHPVGAPVPEDFAVGWNVSGGAPDVVRLLRTFDKGLPVISGPRVQQAIAAVVEAVASENTEGAERLSITQIEVLSRAARERAQARAQLVLRPHAMYILRTLNRLGIVRPSLTTEQASLAIRDWVYTNAYQNGLIEDPSATQAELSSWLGVTPRKAR